MCSRHARIRPSTLLDISCKKKLSPSTIVSPNAAISPCGERGERKRAKSWRRPTGPLSPDDLELAMFETEKEEQLANGPEQMSTGTIVTHVRQDLDNTDSGEGHSKGQNTSLTVQVGEGDEKCKPINSKKGIYQLAKMDSLVLRRYQLSQPPSHIRNPDEFLDIDYKKLYEMEKAENEGLRFVVKELETRLHKENEYQEIKEVERKTIFQVVQIEMMERIAQLEDELKIMETIRADNQRLKEENGALIRVISKLSK